MNKYMKNFSENLKMLIGEESVNAFSKKINIPQPTITRYLTCKREVSLENLCKIADYFQEDIDNLLGRKEY